MEEAVPAPSGSNDHCFRAGRTPVALPHQVQCTSLCSVNTYVAYVNINEPDKGCTLRTDEMWMGSFGFRIVVTLRPCSIAYSRKLKTCNTVGLLLLVQLW